MSKYTYVFEDLLTKAPIDELPLYGTYFDVYLNQRGTFTGTIRMDTSRRRPADILAATMPGKTAVYVEVDDAPMWGGIIWSRTYQSDGRSMQIYAETFEGFANHQYNEIASFGIGGLSPLDAVQQIWASIQSDPKADIDMITPALGDFPNETPFLTKVVNDFEQTNLGKMLDDFAGQADRGFDFYTRVFKDVNGVRQRQVLVGRPLGAPSSPTSNLVFRYPGNIRKYYFPENASRASNRLLTKGKGDDATAFRWSYTDSSSLDAGYPRLMNQITYSDEDSVEIIANRTKAAGEALKIPITVPTIEINPNVDPVFGSYSLGDYGTFSIEDPYRFPEGLTAQWRIIGITHRPGDSAGVTEGTLIIQGDDLGV